MRTYKLIDAIISTALIVFCLISYFLDPSLEKMILYYCIVGGWQTLSMIVHALQKWFTRKQGFRYVYHWITFFSLITLPLGSYWILAFTAPFMAVCYTILCYTELLAKTQRPLSLIKN